ncbi:MAG: UDP-N-acetylmuramoyl-L-alanyl-D-glutamate--2,6-diaminopimelate ligase [Planctomycetota bacterium]
MASTPQRPSIDLADLARDLPVRLPHGATPAIRGVTEDSRLVEPGWLFVARAGCRVDGAAYLGQAIERGAVAVVARPGIGVDGAVHVACEDPAATGAEIIERWHGSPSRTLAIAGVTGTNGKTTVCALLRQLLEASGVRCGLMGTIEHHDGADSCRATLTSAPAEVTSGTLARMVANGCGAAAIEASSHALDQRRLAGVRFRAGVFTGLSGDHLDYHGTLDDYAAAKARLFGALDADALAVVNADDPQASRMLRDCGARVLRCSANPAGADAWVAATADGLASRVELGGPWGVISGRLPLPGSHNAMNALQAVAVAHAFGASAEDLERALPTLAPPAGRLERIEVAGVAGPLVFVDFAHTDDALDKTLAAVAGGMAGGRLWVVFGCGGDRDRTKRPRMGAAAARHAHHVVVTSDNPRTEDPTAIIDDVLGGVGSHESVRCDPDRERAIRLAIEAAAAGDLVVIAGKGHEDYQILPDGEGGTVRRAFDDREIARAALRARAMGSVA